jgi:hypothetical protein
MEDAMGEANSASVTRYQYFGSTSFCAADATIE